jgi:hypothetical protein
VRLQAELPRISGEWGNITAMSMTLSRRFTYRGRTRSYLSAGCPAPPGIEVAAFPLIRAEFGFEGREPLVSTVTRSCRVRG